VGSGGAGVGESAASSRGEVNDNGHCSEEYFHHVVPFCVSNTFGLRTARGLLPKADCCGRLAKFLKVSCRNLEALTTSSRWTPARRLYGPAVWSRACEAPVSNALSTIGPPQRLWTSRTPIWYAGDTPAAPCTVASTREVSRATDTACVSRQESCGIGLSRATAAEGLWDCGVTQALMVMWPDQIGGTRPRMCEGVRLDLATT
jgi:hypothetical protein